MTNRQLFVIDCLGFWQLTPSVFQPKVFPRIQTTRQRINSTKIFLCNKIKNVVVSNASKAFRAHRNCMSSFYIA